MKVTEARFTRRYNVGQYEHEEYTVIAQLEEDDSIVDALVELKSDVQKAYAGEAATTEGASETDDTSEDDKPAKPSKKSRKSRTTTPSEDEETDESEEETGGEETDTDSEEDEAEESEDEAEESEEDEDAPPAKKPAAKKTPSKDGAKGSKKFKKKPQVYQRANEAHKDLFSGVLKKVAPNWKKSFESKAQAKKASQKLEGKEFLDDNGKVVPSFEAAVKTAMGKFGK